MIEDLIKEFRLDAKLTQDELAQKFNMSRSTLSRYETGEREPDLDFLIKFSDYFEVSVDYLLGKTRIPTPQYTLHNLENHSPSTLKKLNKILYKFNDESFINIVYSLISKK